jgi:hypothetical protein
MDVAPTGNVLIVYVLLIPPAAMGSLTGSWVKPVIRQAAYVAQGASPLGSAPNSVGV